MKKQTQLGMNPSTAQGRLVKDLLFKFVQLHHPNCYHCGGTLTRETFSIEHKTPWLDSEDPVGLFFNLDNIDFSHHRCNIGAVRKPMKKYASMKEKRAANWASYVEKKPYCPKRRRARYEKHGT